jgi:hypothetical protein
MRRILPTLAAILTLSGAAHAQVPGNSPVMGATSPLGVLGATTAPATSGIPLGATDINPGGLSPMPLATCPTTSTTTSNGTFDGGGLTGCTATTFAPSLSGTTSPLAAPGSDPTQSGGAIPLNATEINNGGISPFIVGPTTMPGVPTPSTTMAVPTATSGLPGSSMTPALPSTSPCLGTTATTGLALMTGNC